MQYFSKNKMFGVEVSTEIWAQLQIHCTNAGRMETGGIILGKYKVNHQIAIITEITGPPMDSSKGYAWFNRGIKGLKNILNKNWLSGYYYIGEWHFHPYASPNPSYQDEQQMKAIALSKKYNCPEPILIIVGGSPKKFSLLTFVATGKNHLIELYPETSSE